MKVQTKILLLLFLIVLTFIGGLIAMRALAAANVRAIAATQAEERQRIFDQLLAERGDNLKVLVEDSTNWDDLVRAIAKSDLAWADSTINEDTLAKSHANAIWIYRPDLTLFASINNRYDEKLREAPLPPGALRALFAAGKPAHFFLHVEEKGWMEIRGSTVHPSLDRFRETKPQGYFLAGHFWINENIRRMAQFTDYKVRIITGDEIAAVAPGAEEEGRIRFTRDLAGWDGRRVAQILVEHDSPVIREFNAAGRRLFLALIVFAIVVFLILSISLVGWVRHPLRVISGHLQNEEPAELVPLSQERNEFGRLAQLILRSRNTEEMLQQAEEQLRHSQKIDAVGRLAGGVAHDFNNLLTAIIGYSELLEIRFENDPSVLEEVRMIRNAGERAAALTKQLLAFSRKQILQPVVLDLNALVRETDKLLHRVIGEHIRIVHHLTADDARVRVDPGQLEQVLINLGVNARDAMPRGGTLTITTAVLPLGADELASRGIDSQPGEYVALAVSDTGSGMDNETLVRIFEPFFTTKGPGKGTGLGLSTVYGIVKQSGGGISVETEMGRGSQFTIFLPRETAPVEPPKPGPSRVERTSRAETILVAEDEEVVRQLICAVLRDAGYEVLCAATPAEAIEMARQHCGAIDLFVTDIVMPEMHGPALAAEIAALCPRVRTLYVSGYSENEISAQGVITPALEFLPKPFSHQSLIRKVQEILAEPRPT
jgi:signal transduction histidine kinase/ActR/RegA family two-component response regulator